MIYHMEFECSYYRGDDVLSAISDPPAGAGKLAYYKLAGFGDRMENVTVHIGEDGVLYGATIINFGKVRRFLVPFPYYLSRKTFVRLFLSGLIAGIEIARLRSLGEEPTRIHSQEEQCPKLV